MARAFAEGMWIAASGDQTALLRTVQMSSRTELMNRAWLRVGDSLRQQMMESSSSTDMQSSTKVRSQGRSS